MSLISRIRKQTAVYWAPNSSVRYDKYGDPIIDPPVQIYCRWEDTQEEFIDAQGTKQISKSRVFVDEDDNIEIGGILMLGTLADIEDNYEPKENDDAWEVKGRDKIPNLKNTETLVMVYL